MAEVKARLLGAIESTVARLIQETRCAAISEHIGQYLITLRDCRLWPTAEVLRETSISNIFNRMLSFQEPVAVTYKKQGCSCYRKPTFKDNLRDGKEIVSNLKTGICLDCVKTGRASIRNNECRIRHSLSTNTTTPMFRCHPR